MDKKQPERMCAVCRKKGNKNSLIRIVKDNNGNIFIDQTCKANGRGMYICKSQECVGNAFKSRAVNRSFKVNADPAIYEELKKFNEHNEN